jgi:hypothetical protein
VGLSHAPIFLLPPAKSPAGMIRPGLLRGRAQDLGGSSFCWCFDSEKLGAPVAFAVGVTTADGIDFHVIVGHGLNVRFSFHGEHSFSVRSHHGWREEEYEVVAVAGTFPA